jgi:hypothetical protein
MAALETLDRIIIAMDKNELPLCIFLDLSKAFDTLDHHILVEKLQYYGLHGVSLKLMENYLLNRKQYVSFQDVKSDLLNIKTGVPQGSILGPLLFIIYLNDLIQACDIFKPIVYADDTALSATLEAFEYNHQYPFDNINFELVQINHWFKANKLSINGSKTKAMLFHTTHRNIPNIVIEIDGVSIQFVREFNYLGIYFDCNITWKTHIKHIFNKISRTSGVLTKLKQYLPTEALKLLYNSLIFPYLNYGLLAWGTSAGKLYKLQKKVIRIIANAKYNAHTQPLFKKHEILTINDTLSLQELKFIYKFEHGTLPCYFRENMFRRQYEVHDHSTRHADNFQIPLSRHSFAKNSIRYRLPLTYNNCSLSIKEKIHTHSFQGYTRYIKKKIIDDYEDTCQLRNCYVCQHC